MRFAEANRRADGERASRPVVIFRHAAPISRSRTAGAFDNRGFAAGVRQQVETSTAPVPRFWLELISPRHSGPRIDGSEQR